MQNNLIELSFDKNIAKIMLNDPERRNAMSIAMFDGLDEALSEVSKRNDTNVLLLYGNGKAFCSGFDLAAAKDDLSVLEQFIIRLSTLIRSLRRLHCPVVAAAHKAAIAGGCATVSACDIVVASQTTKFGYPVHKLGVSPAVNIATLQQAIGPGATRSLLMGGELIDGKTAHRLGLVHHLVNTDNEVLAKAKEICETLARQSPQALRVTKKWLNELDGSDDDDLFDGPRDGSAEIAQSDEASELLDKYWANKQ